MDALYPTLMFSETIILIISKENKYDLHEKETDIEIVH